MASGDTYSDPDPRPMFGGPLALLLREPSAARGLEGVPQAVHPQEVHRRIPRDGGERPRHTAACRARRRITPRRISIENVL